MSSDARNAQPRASGVGCSLLHLPRPGSGRGWLARQAAGARGNLRPPARASSSAGARLTRGRASALRERPGTRREPRARGQVQPGTPQSRAAQRQGPAGRPQATVAPCRARPAAGTRAVGPGVKRAQRRRSLGHGPAPLARRRGGGGASECFL